MHSRFSKHIIAFMLLGVMSSVRAEGWCNLQPGYELISHGNMSDRMFLVGQLVGRTEGIWIEIANGDVGKGTVALILAAQIAGKGLGIYLDAPSATCANFQSWAPFGSIRHVRIVQ